MMAQEVCGNVILTIIVIFFLWLDMLFMMIFFFFKPVCLLSHYTIMTRRDILNVDLLLFPPLPIGIFLIIKY